MSKNKLQLKIVTPEKTVYSGKVDYITLTTSSGEITVLPNHIPLISHLVTGHVVINNDEKDTYFAIDSGILEVRHNNYVVILSDNSEKVHEIDLERAEKAIKEAEEYMKNPEKVGFDYTALQAKMKKEQNRVRLARKGHRR